MREITHRDVRRRFLGLVAAALAVVVSGCAADPTADTATIQTFHAISGTVSGAVAAGVTVGIGGRSAVTDANGNYTLTRIADGTYTVTPSLAWYTFSPTSRTITVSGANVTGVDFTATAIPRTFTITGEISGDVVANVTVTLSAVSGTPASATATSDVSGAFTFTGLSSGVYLLVPSSPGCTFAPAESLVTVTDQDVAGPYFLAFSAVGKSISGTVSGAVSSGVRVALSGAVSGEINTGASGTYVFTDLVDGNYVVTAALDGYVFAPQTFDVALSGTAPISTGNDFVATELARTYAISGAIRGDAVAGVKVTLSGTRSAEATTNATGNYSFTGLANGSYVVTPSLGGFTFGPASSNVTVSGASVWGMDFVSTASCTITGTVVGALAPVTIDMTLLDAPAGTTATDAVGGFRFICAGDGSYMLFPSLPGYTFDPESRTFTVGAGASVTGLDFDATVVPQTFAIVGAISGQQVAFVPVTLSAVVGSPASAMVRTDQDGNFAFTGLSNGTYIVTPDLLGYVFEPWNSLVTVDGENVSGPFFTSAKAANRVVAGTISGPAVLGTVTLTLSGAADASATASAAGEYFFGGLADGGYVVTPSAPGYGFTPDSIDVTVSGGDVTGVDFVSWVGYRISGTIRGDAAPGVTMTLSGDATKTVTPDDTGAYSFPAVPAGSYVVTPSLGGYSFSPASVNVTLVNADAPGTDFVATLFCVISGYVLPLLPPGEDVTLTISGAGSGTTKTESGHYDFICASEGSYMVIPSLPGYSFTPGSRTLTVSGARVANQDFVATPVP